MKLRAIYRRESPEKYKLKISYDKSGKKRPAWIKILGLPEGTRFISVHHGKKGKEGMRVEVYQTYLPSGLFLPIYYTHEEMSKFYDEWSSGYDKEFTVYNTSNIEAAKFFANRVKKHIKRGEMLDLGAGTGLMTEIFVKQGFYPATLVDYSKGMLEKAKKKDVLRKCTFIHEDIRKLRLKKKFDLVLSFFSLGSSSYFRANELDEILKKVSSFLKKDGVIAVFGYSSNINLEDYFKTLEKGIYTMNKKEELYTDYYIGRKK